MGNGFISNDLYIEKVLKYLNMSEIFFFVARNENWVYCPYNQPAG